MYLQITLKVEYVMNTEKNNFRERLPLVGEAFKLKGTIVSYEIINNGHINTTVKVNYVLNDKRNKSYLFQKINTFVFREPVGVMENIDKVTSYILKNNKNGYALHFHHTYDGNNYFITDDGEFWRVMNYIESVTFDKCEDDSFIHNVGKAFGRFQRQLSDFDGSELHETIPDFHNTRKRLDDFFNHYENLNSERKAMIRNEAEYLYSVKELACQLWDRFERGEFPVRVSHNDTKANNVLFDKKTKEPLVVVDLDTVMPGMASYDFGDAVRFIASTAVEDEKNLSKVTIDKNKFTSLAQGFISEIYGIFTDEEIDSLVLASFSVTIELASRFIDDYLCNDVYFSIDYPEHNLDRGRCQLALAKKIYENFDELEKIIKSVCNQKLKNSEINY